MKTLTIYQPWASLVAIGAKKIETRSWATKYRGLLAIHAGQKWTPQLQAISKKDIFFNVFWPEYNGKYVSEQLRKLPLGVVLATCRLVDCILITPEFVATLSEQEVAFGDYSPGRYAWILEDPKPLPQPVPAKGGRRLWNWEGADSGLC